MATTHKGRTLSSLLKSFCTVSAITALALPLAVAIPGTASAATDGALDTTFNPGGAGANKAVRAMAFASDGKIYIGGDFTTYNGTAVSAFTRLNKDGTLDESSTLVKLDLNIQTQASCSSHRSPSTLMVMCTLPEVSQVTTALQ